MRSWSCARIVTKTSFTACTRTGKKRSRSPYLADDVYAAFIQRWKDPAYEQASERAKKNRLSASGLGTKHTTGSINVAEHHALMAKKYGPHVDYPDVFVSTHTTQGAPDQPPQWIDQIAESTFNAYKTAVNEEVSQGRLENSGTIPWNLEIWQTVVSQGRKKRGERLYGLGDYGEASLPSTITSQVSQSTGGSHAPEDDSSQAQIEALEARVAEQARDLAEMRAQMAAFMQHQHHGSSSSP